MRLACEMVMEVSFFMLPRMTKGPEALMTVEEIVRSVRFWRRESQTPVSLLRELMQVKEWREEERSVGKRMGEMGQSRKERE